jgi:hypothetical protein
MKHICGCLMLVLLAGCSGSPDSTRLAATARRESARLKPPSQRLSEFSAFELKAMEMNTAVSERQEKVEVAGELEKRLHARLEPLLEAWKADPNRPQTGDTLVITPRLQGLRVVSGGARFWIGEWAGDSTIDMDLELTNARTGAILANPRIIQAANAMGGAWTVGATDKNLLNYVAEVAHQYLSDSYRK